MPHAQSASAVMMIRPVAFQSNPLTADSNSFQDFENALVPEEAQKAALKEFDRLVSTLRAAGVHVLVVEDTVDPHTPDSVFPNNWISTHTDGTAVTYPMLAVNRRLERRDDVLTEILPGAGFDVRNVVDLSPAESQGKYLEGTGSLVLDRQNRIAYACIAPRTDNQVLADFSQALNYEAVVFTAVDRHDQQIYHTNVLMCVGTGYAVICAEAISDERERRMVLDQLSQTGHELVIIDYRQLEHFAGNMLELITAQGKRLLVMSTRALESLTDEQKHCLKKYVSIISSDISVIEDSSGGSVRCMLAELFLPTSQRFQSLQEQYLPNNQCFGCGAANDKGLGLKSFVSGDEVVADWMPESHHAAASGVLNGGIIGTLLDCHMAWAALLSLLGDSEETPSVVTSEYAIKLLQPTSCDYPVRLRARVVSSEGRRVKVRGELLSDSQVRVTCEGTFVAVKPGHPASQN